MKFAEVVCHRGEPHLSRTRARLHPGLVRRTPLVLGFEIIITVREQINTTPEIHIDAVSNRTGIACR